MNRYRTAAIGVVSTFFVSVTVTVLLPMVMFNPTPSGNENIYPKLISGNAARGRRIYIREGCMYCHSEFTRLQDRGLGPLSQAGDFVNETPHQLGTERTGPDLSNEAARFPNGWQRAHLINPRALKPGSIMPSFSFLSNSDLDDLVAYIQSLGARRLVTDPYLPPEEYARYLTRKSVDTDSDRTAQIGRGLYTQNCVSCHGLHGHGNGLATMLLVQKPSDFAQGRFNQYSDLYWFYRISEGIPGSSMPRFAETLSEDQRWYLVAYLKTLRNPDNKAEPIEVPQSYPVEMRHTHQHWEPPVSNE